MFDLSQDQVKHFLNKEYHKLSDIEYRIIERLRARKTISKNIQHEMAESLTLGERLADRVAAFGGSWTFIILFCFLMVSWMSFNTFVLLSKAFDPYPYILLNLVLSCVASLQAPIIMMSQNRQSSKDRLQAEHDYEVNLKAELEIMQLHQKIDELMQKRWETLMALQEQQVKMLTELTDKRADSKPELPD